MEENVACWEFVRSFAKALALCKTPLVTTPNHTKIATNWKRNWTTMMSHPQMMIPTHPQATMMTTVMMAARKIEVHEVGHVGSQ
jgi:hypothetical protein